MYFIMCPLYSRHVSALILGYLIKYFVNCCEKESIIYS
jgi:hypothetical protein